MNFTREDLQRIAKGLKQLSIKDTQFANATALTTETKFPVVQGNVNVLLTSAQLLNFLVSNLDANSLTLNIPNWTSGTLSNLISRLYTIASAPRDEEGNPITAEDIEYSHYIDEEIANVADALDYVIAELLEKVDAVELAGTPRISPTQMPIITLANIEPASTCPISTGSGMWFDENHVLQYRNGAVTPAEDVEIGAPVDMLYYYDNNIYKYDVSSQAFTKVGSADLSSCIKVDSNTSRMPYAMMPWVVLLGLKTPTAQVLNRLEEFCYYNKDTRKIVFHKANMALTSYDPQPGVIYVDKSSGSVIIWNGDSTNPWTVVGGMQDISSKADLLVDANMLEPEQWPHVIINNIGDTDHNDDQPGDVIYNTSDRHLYLFKGYDDDIDLSPIFVDMGMPQLGTIYCLKSVNSLYKWTGDVNNPWSPILAGKADLAPNVNMLSVNQWPKVVISSATPITYAQALNTLSPGDLFVATNGVGVQNLYILGTSNAIVNIDVSTTTLYYAKDSKRFFLYNGVAFVPATNDQFFVIDYMVANEGIYPVPTPGDVWYEDGQLKYAYNNGASTLIASLGAPSSRIIYCNAEDDTIYRWTGSSWQQVGGNGGGGGLPGADGKSAYEIAVENGFEGTETEWLASLKGEQGATGNCTITGDGSNIVSQIVNNLTDGGSGKILSAEMGKELYGMIRNTPTGTYAEAFAEAKTNNFVFPWMLIDSDGFGTEITKMIWHVGNRKFVDAIGAEVVGLREGFTVTSDGAGTISIADTINGLDFVSIAFDAGITNFGFDEIADALIEGNDAAGSEYDGKTFTGMSVSSSGSYVDIDFGGMKLTGTASAAIKDPGDVLRSVRQLQVAGSMEQLFKDFTALKEVHVYGTATKVNSFCQNVYGLERVNIAGLELSQSCTGINSMFNTSSIDSKSFSTLDIRGFDTSDISNFNGFCKGKQKLKKLIIGNFSTASATDATNLFLQVSGLTAVCTTTTPPVIKSGYNWLSKASTILVPATALSAYQQDSYWGEDQSKLHTYQEGEY